MSKKKRFTSRSSSCVHWAKRAPSIWSNIIQNTHGSNLPGCPEIQKPLWQLKQWLQQVNITNSEWSVFRFIKKWKEGNKLVRTRANTKNKPASPRLSSQVHTSSRDHFETRHTISISEQLQMCVCVCEKMGDAISTTMTFSTGFEVPISRDSSSGSSST